MKFLGFSFTSLLDHHEARVRFVAGEALSKSCLFLDDLDLSSIYERLLDAIDAYLVSPSVSLSTKVPHRNHFGDIEWGYLESINIALKSTLDRSSGRQRTKDAFPKELKTRLWHLIRLGADHDRHFIRESTYQLFASAIDFVLTIDGESLSHDREAILEDSRLLLKGLSDGNTWVRRAASIAVRSFIRKYNDDGCR